MKRAGWPRVPGPLQAGAAAGERILAWVEDLGDRRVRTSAKHAFRTGALVGSGVLITLAALATMVGAISGFSYAVSRLARTRPPVAPLAPTGRSVVETMTIQTGKQDGRPGWPRFTPASFVVRGGETVVLRIVNHDSGTAPLTGAQAGLSRVEGVIGGTESVNGRPLASIPAEEVSHTFTLIGLGVNIPIPPAPQGGSTTVVARFVASKRGSFLWQCYAPCGSGPNSMGGAMASPGWMEGSVRVR